MPSLPLTPASLESEICQLADIQESIQRMREGDLLPQGDKQVATAMSPNDWVTQWLGQSGKEQGFLNNWIYSNIYNVKIQQQQKTQTNVQIFLWPYIQRTILMHE